MHGACFGFHLPLAACCSLSVPLPFKQELGFAVPSLCTFRRETLSFPVSLVQCLDWACWQAPFRVSAHHHLGRTGKRKQRGHGKPSSSLASFQTKQEVPKVFPAIPWKGRRAQEGQTCLETAWECSPLQGSTWAIPIKSSYGQGIGSQDFSALSQTTLRRLGQVITLFSTFMGGKRRGYVH